MLAVPGWNLSDGSHVTARAGVVSAYEVSMHLVQMRAVLLGSRSAGVVLLPGWST